MRWWRQHGRGGSRSRTSNNREQVQQQRDSPIAEDGGTADQVRRDQAVVNAFDNEFFFSAQLINSQRVTTAIDGNYDGVKAFWAAARSLCVFDGGWIHVSNLSRAADWKQWKHVFAQPNHVAAINDVNVVWRGADDFRDAGDRKRVGFVVSVYQQTFQDC